MTELQLRLWCLWMCEEFAEMGSQWINDELAAAAEGASMSMFDMLCGMCGEVDPLTAWKLSERMP